MHWTRLSVHVSFHPALGHGRQAGIIILGMEPCREVLVTIGGGWQVLRGDTSKAGSSLCRGGT